MAYIETEKAHHDFNHYDMLYDYDEHQDAPNCNKCQDSNNRPVMQFSNEAYLNEHDENVGFNFTGNYSVITQPPHHIIKGKKIVPILPVSILVTLIVTFNLIVIMIFVDLLARQAVGTTTGFGLWGPSVVIIFTLGTLLVCK